MAAKRLLICAALPKFFKAQKNPTELVLNQLSGFYLGIFTKLAIMKKLINYGQPLSAFKSAIGTRHPFVPLNAGNVFQPSPFGIFPRTKL